MRWSAFVAPVILLLAPLPASAQTPEAPQPYQIVRLGDGQMTCEALVTEINALNGHVHATENALTERSMEMSREAMSSAQRSMAGNTAIGLGSMVASFIPGADLIMGAAASMNAASQRAQMSNDQNRMIDEVEDMMADTSAMGPMSQRLEHLSEISRGKGC